MAELAKDDDEEVDDTPLVFKCARTSSSIKAPIPLTVVPPPPPLFATTKRKRTGHTKSTIATSKRHRPSDLEAQEKAELEDVLAESLKEQQERLAKEKADAEALEAALKMSKEEATIHIASEDSDDTIQKILKTPINEDFLRSSAPSTSSIPPHQTKASEDYTLESASNEYSVDSPPPSSSQITTTDGVTLEPLRVVIPVDKDPLYAPCAAEPLVRWSVPFVDYRVQKEDFDCIIIGESSSSRRCIPLPSEDRPAPPPFSQCLKKHLLCLKLLPDHSSP